MKGSGSREMTRLGEGLDVSVIIPSFNEEENIAFCLESVLANANHFPGTLEIIVVDGLSEDNTREIVENFMEKYNSIKLIDNPQRVTPIAMNLGIEAAKGEFILILGAHSRLGKGYITSLHKRLLDDENIGCIGGRTVVTGDNNIIHRCIAATMMSPLGAGNAYYRLDSNQLRQVDTVAYGLYRATVFEEIGLFDERLVRNQDMEMSCRIRDAGYVILLDPSVQVYYTPRNSIVSLAKQSFANGYWNIITWRLVPGSLSWRHFAPLAFVTYFLLLGPLSFFSLMCRMFFALGACVYLCAVFFETVKTVMRTKDITLVGISVCFPVLHVSYGLGSIWGLLEETIRLKGERN